MRAMYFNGKLRGMSACMYVQYQLGLGREGKG